MGSIENIVTLFINGFYGILNAGSAAAGTGSDVAEGVLGQAAGSISGIAAGL